MRFFNCTSLSLVGQAFFIAVTCVLLISAEEDLTDKEKEALAQIKTAVLDKLPHDWMKEDLYLIRFLKANHFSVEMTEQALLDNVKWREENKIDTIHEENFDDITSLGYKTHMECYDKEGRPIVTTSIVNWDLRKAAVAGIFRRLERYSDKNFEMASRKVREQRAAGKNISQFDYIVNMDTFNKIQHGCDACIPMYIYKIKSYEQHYPGQAGVLILFNTPPVFQEVLNVIRPFMSSATNNALKILDDNKPQWEAELRKYVDESEIPKEYGGKKVYST